MEAFLPRKVEKLLQSIEVLVIDDNQYMRKVIRNLLTSIGVKTVHEAVDGIVFLHKVAPGSADKSYGIHVAQRAGVPAPVLERAREVLAELEAHHLNTPERAGAKIRKPKIIQASLFARTDDPVLEALRAFDVDGRSLEEVVEQVRRWRGELGTG